MTHPKSFTIPDATMTPPVHPGQRVRAALPAGVPVGAMAARLGVTRQALSALINGRAGVSAPMALRLEAVLATPAEQWLEWQTAYDLWVARQHPPVLADQAAKSTPVTSTAEGDTQLPAPLAGLQGPIATLCDRYGVRELALFGSVLREDFDPASSDIDAVVSFGPPNATSLVRQYFDFKQSLETLFGRPVDLVELDAMPETRLKRIIERSKRTVYAAAA